jgi:VRR-NUC domain
MSESATERQCRVYAMSHGVPSMKLSGNVAGDPDRIFLMPNRRCLLVEFKQPEGRLSPRQKYRHTELLSYGHPVAVVYSTQEFKTLLDELLWLK